MNDLTTKQKRHLRQIIKSALACERDMAICLEVVAAKFDAWRREEISVWELNDLIPKFHNEIAMELYMSYSLQNQGRTAAIGYSPK